ncbi:MAG: 50S ribosomal protein L10 [Legionellales bacterium]|nr:50S ribosomal protein L10 [Legionellales bacterium]
MTLRLQDKKEIVAEFAKVASMAHSAVAADPSGLTVAKLNELRANGRKQDVHIQVIRNTLAALAVEGTAFECMKEAFVGPMILGFSLNEPGAVARLFRDFAKQNDKMTIKVVSIGGQVYDASKLEAVAKLPTRDEAISLLMAVMKAPIAKFVRTLVQPHTKLVRTIDAVRLQKEAVQ